MPDVALKIEVTTESKHQFEGQINRWQEFYVRKMRTKVDKVSQLVAIKIRNKIVSNIVEGRRWDGKKLVSNSEATMLRKKSSLPLIQTGRLAGSIKYTKDGSDGYIIHVNPNAQYPLPHRKPVAVEPSVKFWSKVHKVKAPQKGNKPVWFIARIMQFGNKKNHTPPRPFWGITEQFKKELISIIKRYTLG